MFTWYCNSYFNNKATDLSTKSKYGTSHLPFKAKWLLYVPAHLAASGLALCIYGFCMILSVVTDYFLTQRYPVDLRNGEVWCSL
jgi:hypothetical protein